MLNVLLLMLMISQISETVKIDNSTVKTVNVKTVLFKETDNFRDCWSHRETSLLITRYQMQMLLPSGIPNDVQVLSEYLNLCLSTVSKESAKLDKCNRLILTEAVSDVLGGYIHSYGLPFLYKMLYAGKAEMTKVKKLIDLSGNFKNKLDTNGKDWTSPIKIDNYLETVTPAKMICNAYFDFCDTLIFDDSKNRTNNIDSCEVYRKIRLPILDDIQKPNAIAIPVKGLKITNLNKFTTCKPILTIYYKTVICCGDMHQLSSKNECSKERSYFVRKFSIWLDTVLATLLNDNVCHPPLMGILKLKRTVDNSIENEKRITEVSMIRSKENKELNRIDVPVSHFRFFMISFFITGLFWAVILSFKCISDKGKDESEIIRATKLHESITEYSPDEIEMKTKIRFTESFSNRHTQDVTAHYLFDCERNSHQVSEFSDNEYDADSSSTNGK